VLQARGVDGLLRLFACSVRGGHHGVPLATAPVAFYSRILNVFEEILVARLLSLILEKEGFQVRFGYLVLTNIFQSDKASISFFWSLAAGSL
jgi:hypothetical protein